MASSVMYEYSVDSVKNITPSTLLLTLQKDEGERIFPFLPGQYAAISFYRHRRPTAARCFSVVSSPTTQDKLQFSMRAKGHYTKAIAGLQKGDKVKVRGPFGGFVLNQSDDVNAVFLAGGIGITPFMSMATYAAAVQSKLNITLLYSCQNQEDVPFLSELKDLEKKNPNFKVIFILGEGPSDKLSGQRVVSGRITPELLDEVTSHKYFEKYFYICGPPPFMKAMVATLQSKGATKHHIITEAFAQGSHRQTGKIKSWPYNIYALSAVGLALGSFTVMVSDIFNILPPSTLSQYNESGKTLLKNKRQEDLDALVNSMTSARSVASPDSAAVTAANKAANDAAAATQTVVKKQAAPTTSTPTSTTTTQTTQPTATTPPPKKCTTTQSGVTTCV